jgi:hypothetical protein
MCMGDGGGMKHTTTVLAALIALQLVTGIESAASEHSVIEPVSVIQAGSADQVENVAAALELFAHAGLELPPIDVYLHSNDEGCSENLGLYRPGSGVDRIDVCSNRLFITLHEFAHAWENRSATDDVRQELLDGIGLESWTGGDVNYRKRGIEAAANLMAWGLIAPSAAESGLPPDTDRLELFVSFTGVEPLRYANQSS